MLKDRMIIWILEYILGGMLVVVPLSSLVVGRLTWSYPHTWATKLFVTSLGVILISCASSMRQRILLAGRIDRLAGQMQEYCTSSHTLTESKNQIEENE